MGKAKDRMLFADSEHDTNIDGYKLLNVHTKDSENHKIIKTGQMTNARNGNRD